MYIRPYYPHELDMIPEGARILAHIEAERDEIEGQSAFDLDKALDEQEDEHKETVRGLEDEYEDKLKEATDDRDDALDEAHKAKEELRAYYSLLEDLAFALLKGNQKLLATTMAGIGKALVAENAIDTVDAAELEGACDALIA